MVDLSFRNLTASIACSNSVSLTGHMAKDAPPISSEYQVSRIQCSMCVMLLELDFDTPTESLPKRAMFFGLNNQPAEHTNKCTAREWLRAHFENVESRNLM